MTRLSNRQYPMLHTFIASGSGFYMSIHEAQKFDQRPFRSLLIREWIAYTPDNYVSLVAEVCGDIDKLVNFRRSCRDRMRATIGDAERFCRSLEAAYRTMWRRWCEKGGS